MPPLSYSVFKNKGDGRTGFYCSDIAQSLRMKCLEQQRAGSESCMWLRLGNKDLWLRTRERQWFQISMSLHASSHFFCIKTKTTSFPYPVVWLRCGYCISRVCTVHCLQAKHIKLFQIRSVPHYDNDNISFI